MPVKDQHPLYNSLSSVITLQIKDGDVAISSVQSLREHLQWAIQLEHSTIPPYLTALYSLKPDTNVEARHIITSVMIEEMLHMTLAANVLNAIGGEPSLDRPDFLLKYPAYLPHSNKAFKVSLEPFSKGAVEAFMKIEKPSHQGDPPEDDNYETIGQFYEAIEEGLKSLATELGEDAMFTGDPARQITPEHFDYHASGHIVAVTDLKTALEALDEIVEQGEGHDHQEVWDGDRDMFHHERDEVAHYYRYMEIMEGRSFKRGDTPQSGPTGDTFPVDWDAVYPLRVDPRTSQFKGGSEVVATMGEFNMAYSDMLRMMQRAFNGEPDVLSQSLPAMRELSMIARRLVQLPSGDGETNAAPSYEYLPAPTRAASANDAMKITVREQGPYVVEGGVPLTRKSIIRTDEGEPLSWQKDGDLETSEKVRLCRCGQSKHKPFCDNSHAHADWDGTETASTSPTATRARRFEGPGMTMTDDSSLCVKAGFCSNQSEKVWLMIPRSREHSCAPCRDAHDRHVSGRQAGI